MTNLESDSLTQPLTPPQRPDEEEGEAGRQSAEATAEVGGLLAADAAEEPWGSETDGGSALVDGPWGPEPSAGGGSSLVEE